MFSVPFDNSYARLPERFYVKMPPSPVQDARLVALNEPLAIELGLDPAALRSRSALDMFAGNCLPSEAEPLAMAYAGHQFGNWVPQLGDGRALLLGEIIATDGSRRDVQLKGSGRTPFSRMGDGRSALGPVLREYIVSEAMHALGIPSTRSLAAVTTGDHVIREAILPGAILTRIAKSHVRVGTFQYFAARQDREGLRQLADYMIERCYPDSKQDEHPYRSLFDQVVTAQASLVAKWMGVGFIHGVMNTDNMAISGETIDFGPCAFMDAYHPAKVFSSIDEMGRYAFGNQPDIGYWNLACLARAMLPLLGDDEESAIAAGQEAIEKYPEQFNNFWHQTMASKLGLERPEDRDESLVRDFLSLLMKSQADFTQAFRRLSESGSDVDRLGETIDDQEGLGNWYDQWVHRLAVEGTTPELRSKSMCSVNPVLVARNHRVEEAIAAAYANDFAPFERLIQALSSPFDNRAEFADLARPPAGHEVVTQTFCGT